MKVNKVIYPIEVNCKWCSNLFEKKRDKHYFCKPECYAAHTDSLKKPFEDSIKIARNDIFARDNFRCVYCGKSSIEDGVKLQLDHLYPKEKGGSNSPYNIVTCCNACNVNKGGKIYSMDIMYRIWVRTANFSKDHTFTYSDMESMFNKYYGIYEQIDFTNL